jgi:tetratricopeptide (TPR) repeat protein
MSVLNSRETATSQQPRRSGRFGDLSRLSLWISFLRARVPGRRFLRRVTIKQRIYAALALALCVRLYVDIATRTITIEPFRVPDSIKARGYSSDVLTDQVMDRLRGMEAEVSTLQFRDRFSLAGETAPLDFEVPATKLSYRNIVQLLQGFFHREPLVVTGEIELASSEPIAVLIVRLRRHTGVQIGAPIKIPKANVMMMERGLAESILRMIDPPLLAAHIFLYDRDDVEALKLLEHITWADSNPAFVHNLRGVILSARAKRFSGQVAAESTAAAKAEYQAAIHDAPSWGTPYVNLGILLADDESQLEAIEQYRAAISHDRSNVTAYRAWARSLEKGNERKKLEEGIRFHPKAAYAHLYLADFLAQQGEFEAATREYDNSIALEPSSAHMYERKANFLAEHDKLAEAGVFYEKATQLEPQTAQHYVDWANALYWNGDWIGALEKSQQALQIEPYSRVPFPFLAKVAMDDEQCDQVVEAFKGKRDPSFAVDYLVWANLVYSKRGLVDAWSLFETARMLNPELRPVYMAEARVLADQRSFDDATKKVKAALTIQPTDVSLFKEWGDILADHEKWTEAIRQYRLAVLNTPPKKRSQIYFALANSLAKTGADKEAASFRQKAFDLEVE